MLNTRPALPTRRHYRSSPRALAPRRVIRVSYDSEPHTVGDTRCSDCWARPKRCECGGLVHTEFGDYDANYSYWLYSRCDRCGRRD